MRAEDEALGWMQSPWKQPRGDASVPPARQSGTSHASPLQPSSQRQRPGEEQLPCPLQPAGQTGASQRSPDQPSKHEHPSLAEQVPWPLHQKLPPHSKSFGCVLTSEVSQLAPLQPS